MDPMTTSALIGAGSSLIGTFFGGGKKGPSVRDQLIEQTRAQRKLNRTYLQDRVFDAKKAGIHPVYAVGGGASFSPAISVDGGAPSFADKLSSAGQDISRAVGAMADRKERALQLELLNQQVKGQEIDNAFKASQLARLDNPTQSPPPFPRVGAVSEETPVGYAPYAAPLHQVGLDETGRPMRFFNSQDLGDNDWAMLGHTVRYTIPDWVHGRMSNLRDRVRGWFERR